MTVACVATAVVACYSILRESRRVRARLADVEARMTSAERTCADAVGAALALADVAGRAPGESDTDTPAAPPAILGYGQTRSPTARYVYADLRHADGRTERRYISRMPITGGAGGQQAPR